MKTYGISGIFHIKADNDLKSTVEIVNEATNLNLEFDGSGFYEEFPAYTNNVLGINFALLGIPEKEYQFEFHKYDKYDFLISDYSKFKQDEIIDLSETIIKLITDKSDLKCYTENNKNES
jgi:hypothetical protein